eukprot:m.157635 g.157635  ORF g.157635 m.157635 type:complete len:62 (-) comp17974_c1_seq4:49-234(-)
MHHKNNRRQWGRAVVVHTGTVPKPTGGTGNVSGPHTYTVLCQSICLSLCVYVCVRACVFTM